MPRKSEWLQRLPEALEELRHFSAPVIDRTALEKLLRIHRRTAIRLMNTWGGFTVGKTFLIERLQLIERLENLSSGETFTAERVRRQRLAETLDQARRLAPAREVRIEAANDVHHRVLEDLPAGIYLRPGELRIEFFGAEDLLRHLFELSQAIVNDYAQFQSAVEEKLSCPSSPEDQVVPPESA